MAWRQPNKSVKTGYPGKFWRHIIANSTALRNKSGFGLMKLRVFSWTGNQAVEIWRFLEVLFAHCIFSIPRSFLCREMRDGGWNTMLNKIYRMWHKQCCGEWRPNWSHNKVSTSGPGSIMRQGLCVKTKQPEPPPAYLQQPIFARFLPFSLLDSAIFPDIDNKPQSNPQKWELKTWTRGVSPTDHLIEHIWINSK